MSIMAASFEIADKRSLEHPLHEHALTLREISKDGEVECLLCKKSFHGGTYCCEECDFVLHEACARIAFPHQIQEHPSHRDCSHPLTLAQKKRSYRCGECGFNLGALTAIATCLPRQGIGEDTIRHFCHEEHPLSSFRVDMMLETLCRLCWRQISGQVYGCRSCLFLLHGACVRAYPLKIQHPLPRCKHLLTLLAVPPEDADLCDFCCDQVIESRPVYGCEECEVTLHLGCAYCLVKDEQEEGRPSSCAIRHYSHEHPLTPLPVGDPVRSRQECKICRLKITTAEALACHDCTFFLHKSCAEKIPKEIQQHFLHPQHSRLVLAWQKRKFKCDTCRNEDSSPAAFSCEDCEFKLHLTCALQTLSAIEDGAVADISHFAHEHPLRIGFINPISRRCSACEQSIDGVAYCCTTCNDFWLHRSCAKLPLKLEHALHPEHPLLLSEAPAGGYFFCFACHQKTRGLQFYCAECQFYLCVQCSLNHTLKHPRHEHSLSYCKTSQTKQSQCSNCGKRCRYDFYCCLRCNFSLHRDCLHLPPTVDHKSHRRHPLQLRDKFVYGNPHDQYCDYCETIRDPDHGVYRCEECDFSAHIECIIFDYQGEAKGPETWGSDKSSQLNIEIASLKTKIEITRRDLEALRANLQVSVKELAERKNERKF